jgi:hypothetical protein
MHVEMQVRESASGVFLVTKRFLLSNLLRFFEN